MRMTHQKIIESLSRLLPKIEASNTIEWQSVLDFIELKSLMVDAIDKFDKLGKYESVCPHCLAKMTPTLLSHYYSEGGTPVWMCECEEFPKSVDVEKVYQGY